MSASAEWVADDKSILLKTVPFSPKRNFMLCFFFTRGERENARTESFQRENSIVLEYQIWSRLSSIQDRGTAVGVAARYELDGPGFEPWWRQFSPLHILPARPWSPPSLLYVGT